jgi:hypothetical protein
MNYQLGPCPFCGFTNLSINPIARIKAGGEKWRAWVQCGTCNAVGPSVSSDKSEDEAGLLAATLWNRRVKKPIIYQQNTGPEWIEPDKGES